MNERAIHVGVLAAALALAGWVFGVHGRRAQAPSHADEARGEASPLAIIPAGSAFVLSANISQLRQTGLGALLAERFSRLGGSSRGDLSSLCGFDPASVLDQLVLAVPSAGVAANAHSDDFGVVASGHFSAAQITRCASAAVKQRGGDPVESELGRFHSVRDRSRAGGEVAARDGGPLIVSGGSYFRELLDAAQGNVAMREHQDARDARHAELRRALGPGAVLATWLLAEGWFERVSGDNSARLSPLRGLSALAARLDVSREPRVSALLECADPASVAELERLLDQLRSALNAVPLDPALRSAAQRITALRDGRRLRLELTLTEAELGGLLDALLGPVGPAAAVTQPAPPADAGSDVLRIPAR